MVGRVTNFTMTLGCVVLGFTFPTIHEGSEVSGLKSHPNSLTALSEALEDVDFLGGSYPFIGLLEGVIAPFITIGSGPIL